MASRVSRLGVREGYDRWAATYDGGENPLVALDRRFTVPRLDVGPGERILDAGCGTGGHFAAMLRAGSRPTGFDVSRGMLLVTRRKHPLVPLVQADLERWLPARDGAFDAVSCALVGEHLENLPVLFREMYRSLAPGGRLVFSVYRLGALRHRVDDYLDLVDVSGFRDVAMHEHCGDARLVEEIPSAAKYLGRPLLLVVTARRPAR